MDRGITLALGVLTSLALIIYRRKSSKFVHPLVITLPKRPAQLILAVFGGITVLGGTLLFFTINIQHAHASPPKRPRSAIITGTSIITHTSQTTHAMSVFGDGRITSQFLNNDGSNQVGVLENATTIAILFDQHVSTSTTPVDVGVQGDFEQTIPITLNTASTIPGYSEDTQVIYASKVLSYQVAQQTLATTTNNCVLMELDIQNTGNEALTGGKLLYMIDIDAVQAPIDDEGFFDPVRNLVYLTDSPSEPGGPNEFAMGISLFKGDFSGYGISKNYPFTDNEIITELTTPRNAIEPSRKNLVAWLVANVTDLGPGEKTNLIFSLCAVLSPEQGQAGDDLTDSFDKFFDLPAKKSSIPPADSLIIAGQPITYSIALTNSGTLPVYDLVISDTIPNFTNLITYSTSHGNIEANNGVVTVSLEQLDPTSETVTITLSILPTPSLTNGTVLTNQAFIRGQPISVTTNIVTHTFASPVLTLTKQASTDVVVGLPLTYTITVTNAGLRTASNVVVTDTLPAGATHISGGSLSPNGTLSFTIPTIAPNDGSEQVSFVVTTCQQSLINAAYQVITSTEQITSRPGPPVFTQLLSPTLVADFDFSPLQPLLGQTVDFTSTSTTDGKPIISYEWDFGDGSVNTGSNSSHVYSSPGTYTATLTITDACGFTDTVSKTINIIGPDLSVRKQATPNPVEPGDIITYTILIANNGTANATGVIVSDTVPANTTFLTDSISITPSSAGGATGSPPLLATDLVITAGTIVTITYAVSVTAPLEHGTIITNTVWITASEVLTPVVDTVTTTVRALPDIQLTKRSTHNTPLRPGENITYTLIIANRGKGKAADAVISDTLPLNTRFVPDSIRLDPPTAGDPGTTPPILARNLTISPGQTISLTFGVTVNTPLPNGTIISNTASITSSKVVTPASDTVTDIVTSSPLLSIQKSTTDANGPPLEPGDAITYTIVVANSGDETATEAQIFDPLPNNTLFVPNSIRLDPPSAGSAQSTPPTLVDNLTITAGQHITVTYAVAIVSPLTDGTVITNVASVSSLQTPDPISDVVTNTVVATPAVSIEKTGPVTVTVGDTALFTMTVTNGGKTRLRDVTVVDTLVPSVNLVSNGNGDEWLDLSEAWVYTASYTVITPTSSLITNTAIVSASDLQVTVTASDTHTTLITGFRPVLSITKTGPVIANVGDTITFTFTVSHAPGSDNSPVRDLTVTDNYAGQAILISGGDGDTLLEAGEVWVYTADYIVSPSAPSPLINIGTVQGADIEGKQIVATATHSTSLQNFNPVLFVVKDGPAAATINQTVVYTFTVLNFVDMNDVGVLGLGFDPSLLAAVTPGDGSSITITSVIDNIAGPATLISGDAGNGTIDGGEAWIYKANYTIDDNTRDPLTNTVTVMGLDREGETITAFAMHTTDISYQPVIEITTTGPLTATAGEKITLTFTVSHAAFSDGSALGGVNVSSNITGPANRVEVINDNGDDLLEKGETWVYEGSYVIGKFDPKELLVRSMVKSQDKDLELVAAYDTFTIKLFGTVPRKYFPVIFK